MTFASYSAIGVALLAVAVTALIPIAKHRYKTQLTQFCDQYGQQQEDAAATEKDILLIVSPNSGSGKARQLFPTILKELQATSRAVQVYVLKSADDAPTLYKTKDLSGYKTIVLVSGDSTLYELIQGPMSDHDGVWPFAPLLLLPGGSSNVIVSENFGFQTPVEDIIRNGLSSVRKGSIIKISSANASTPTRYAAHTCFDGLVRHLLSSLEKNRGLAAFGMPAILIIMIKSLLTSDKTISPALLHIIQSDSEAMGMNMGFGLSRFDDQMMVSIVEEWPGYKKWFQMMGDNMSGETGKKFKEGRKAEAKMQKTNKYSFTKSGHEFHIISDGTSSLPFRAKDQVDFEILPNAIPYYVASVPHGEKVLNDASA